MLLTLRFIFICLFCSLISFSQDINPPSDLSVCDNDTDEITTFDLNLNDAEILGNQNPDEFLVTYHLTQDDANSGDDILQSPFSNTSNPQTIYVRLEQLSTGNYDTASFSLLVNPIPATANFVSRTFCSVNDQEPFTFDFTSLEPEILNGIPASGIQISYHLAEADAQENVNAISNATSFEAEYYTNYFARVENEAGCL